jgi:hypothetical protein
MSASGEQTDSNGKNGGGGNAFHRNSLAMVVE